MGLVVFFDIAIGFFKQFCVAVQLVFRQRAPQGFAGFAFADFGGLPAFETDFSHDVVDVIHDAFDDDEGVCRAGLLE